MIPMQPCVRSLRAAIPNGSPRLLRSRPLSTTRPSLYSADNILPDVHDPAADLPKDNPYDLLPPGTNILKDFSGNPEHPYRAVHDLVPRIHTSPWRVKTQPFTYLERGYVFPTPALAFAFVVHVWGKNRKWKHYPLWAGCGRRVYMQWFSNQGSEKGLTVRDMMLALACDTAAAKIVGADRVVDCDRGWEKADAQTWAQTMPVAPFYPRQLLQNENMSNFSYINRWIKERAFVPKVVADEEHYPVWSLVRGGACFSQTYWRVVDGPNEVTLLMPSQDLATVELEKRVLMNHNHISRLMLSLLRRLAPPDNVIGGYGYGNVSGSQTSLGA